MEDGIATAKASFVSALGRRDARSAAAVYAEDARLLPPSAELIEGREAIEAFWRAGLDIGVSHVDLLTLGLERRDGVAYEIGRYALRLDSVEGETVFDRGKYVLVHERQADGSWRRVVEMFNPEFPPVRRNHR